MTFVRNVIGQVATSRLKVVNDTAVNRRPDHRPDVCKAKSVSALVNWNQELNMSASQLAKFGPSPTQSLPRNQFVFEPLLDSDEAAQLLRIHPKTLQRMARNGQIHGIQVGKLWRFRASDLEGWIRQKSAV
jgi:excisionase family DNA binding protein